MGPLRAHPRLGRTAAETTSFVDRRDELAQLRRLLPRYRLVTLTGVGGCGKTRLAIRLARDVRRALHDGAWWVDLAPLADPSLLAHTVAGELGLDDQTDRPVPDVLVEHLRGRDLLIVLDSCEHLLDACAELLAVLLPAAPRLRVLCTSRQPLGITGEQIVVVPPLLLRPPVSGPQPPGEEPPAPAMALFAQRAAAAYPGFVVDRDNEDLVAEVCRHLDGLPLAIELAAARLRVLSLDQLAAGLQDRFRLLTGRNGAPPRHRTLQAAFDWSYDLCTPAERGLWARMAVFTTSVDLPAVEAVCGDRVLPARDMLPLLAGLVDQSVLIRDDTAARPRYRLLDTVRAYGLAKLRGQPGQEADLRRRHRDYYLRLAEQAEQDWSGSHQEEVYLRLRVEHPNLRAALEYCLATPGEQAAGLRLAGTLWFYWMGCGFLRDGRHWLDRTLAVVTTPGGDRTKAMWTLGAIAVAQGDAGTATRALDEARPAAERAGDQLIAGYTELSLATVALFAADYTGAEDLVRRGLARFEALGYEDPVSLFGRSVLAQLMALHGDLDGAEARCRQTLARCAERGDRWSAAWAYYVLAVTAAARGRTVDALDHARDGIRLHRIFGNLTGLAELLDLDAQLLAAAGAAERAAILHGATDRIWQILGRQLFGSAALIAQHDRTVEGIRAAIGDQGYDVGYRYGSRFSVDDTIAYALAEHTEPPRPARGPTPPAVPAVPSGPLTRREREVAALVAQGLTNRQIATRLVTSQRTAESHVENILRKLGLNSRTQVAAWVARGGQDGGT